jgi:exopolysaccharide production protein ExoQ
MIKQRADSRFEKIALFCVLLVATGAGLGAYLARQDAGPAYAYSGGNRLIQLIFGSLYLYFLFRLARRYKEALALVKQEKWIAAFWLWALTSAVWSVASSLTISHWIALLGTGIVGLYIALRFEPSEQLNLVAVCLAVVAIASLLTALVFPGIGLAPDGAWQGVFFPKNSLGRMMALGAFCFVFLAIERRRSRWLYVILAVLCGILLLLSQSVTAIVVCLVMLALLPFRKFLTLGNRTFVPLFAFFCVLATPFVAWLALNSNAILRMLSRDSNFTGRVPLWGIVLQEIASRPVFGFGYGAFWTTGEADRIRATIGWAAPNAHNGFLEILLGVGLVGGAFFFVGLVRNLTLAVQVARAGSQIGAAWPLFLIVFNLFYSFTESSLLGANSILTILFVANSYWVVHASFRTEEIGADESEYAGSSSSSEPHGYTAVEI